MLSLLRRPPVILFAVLALAGAGIAAEPAGGDFGKDVQLAPFVVKGQKLSISIHARSNSDRRYGTEFAEDVVGVAYETMQKSTGSGLVIVGREGEPHPVVMMRKLMAMADAGQLDPAVAEKARALEAQFKSWKAIMNIDDDNKEKEKDKDDDKEKGFKITFDLIMPALPVPLEGVGAKLYQLAWAEGFDDAKLEAKLRSLTLADLESDTFAKYDWVFYLPPRNAFDPVLDSIMTQGMKAEKMGLFKRAAIRSAMVMFKPAIRKAVEGFRKGMLFMAVLRVRSGWDKEDVKYLTMAYTNVLMPDFKFNDSEEKTHARVMEAIEKQKVRNVEYAKDPFRSPARLTAFEPAAYALFAGDYGTLAVGKDGKPGKPSRVFVKKDDDWLWQYPRGKPTVLYPAGDRLLVSADGKLTVEFKLDDKGAVTGAEERRVRHRQTYPHPVIAAKK